MWRLFKRRQEGDLRRLVTAYRCFLKAARQSQGQVLLDEQELKARKWKGGFGKAFNQLFSEWPTSHQSRRFEKMMRRWLRRAKDTDQAFILAFNEYLAQKQLSTEELKEVLNLGQQKFKSVK